MADGADGTDGGAPQPTERPKLLVWATVREAYAIWFANFGLWLRLMVPPVIGIVAAVLVLRNLSFSSDREFETIVANLLLIILTFVFAVPAITAWHRLILISEDQTAGKYRVTGRELRYVKLNIAFWLGVGVVQGIFVAIAINIVPLFWHDFELASWGTALIVYATIGGLSAIFGLVFPAAAIGERLSFNQAARYTLGNRWRLFLTSTIASLPVAQFIYMLELVMSAISGEYEPLISEVLDELWTLVYLPATIGFLSIAYRELVERPKAAGGDGAIAE